MHKRVVYSKNIGVQANKIHQETTFQDKRANLIL